MATGKLRPALVARAVFVTRSDGFETASAYIL
jgi:hypothetical protein